MPCKAKLLLINVGAILNTGLVCSQINIKHYELFLWYGRPAKDVKPYFELKALSEILTIANFRHATSRI